MSFLRRLLGREDDAPASAPPDPHPELSPDEAEQRHERDVLAAEAERLDDLRQRQLRYARYAWEPPAQGGERRADDEDRAAGEG
jgi:hypothetical protein